NAKVITAVQLVITSSGVVSTKKHSFPVDLFFRKGARSTLVLPFKIGVPSSQSFYLVAVKAHISTTFFDIGEIALFAIDAEGAARDPYNISGFSDGTQFGIRRYIF